MSFIDLATVFFTLGAMASLVGGLMQLASDDGPESVRSLVIAFALGGVALWSWRISEGLGAFVEALK